MEWDHSVMQEWLNITVDIAKRAGSVLTHYWGKLKDIQEKDFPGDLVTEADKQSEALILESLRTYFPDHARTAEDSVALFSDSENNEWRWFVDPLDGTTNYTHQYPFVAVAMGLTYRRAPVLGVIYNPILNELFCAYQGSGATLNGVPIKVSSVSSLSKSLLATGFAYNRRFVKENNYKEFCHLTHLTQGVRRCGAASLDLAYVAAGRLDGYWESGLKPWDIAAGMVLVQEAGGQLSDYSLQPVDLSSGCILASNSLLQRKISDELMKVKNNSLY